MTRRDAIRAALGFPLGAIAFSARPFPAGAFAPKEFWNDRKPEDWTGAEVKELLTKSPWAKEASIDDKGQVGTLGASRGGAGGRRGGRTGDGQTGTTPSNPPKITWKAIVRWESALPVRGALKSAAPKDVKDYYVLNVIGNLPSAIPGPDEPEDRASLAYLKEVTTLQHKGDAVHLTRVEPAAENELSPAGTRFYFSRMLALMPKDNEATFSTRVGPLDVKCRFTLKDMLYRGELEL